MSTASWNSASSWRTRLGTNEAFCVRSTRLASVGNASLRCRTGNMQKSEEDKVEYESREQARERAPDSQGRVVDSTPAHSQSSPTVPIWRDSLAAAKICAKNDSFDRNLEVFSGADVTVACNRCGLDTARFDTRNPSAEVLV